MQPVKQIKVLVADNSAIHREVLLRGLSTSPCINVITAENSPLNLRDKVYVIRPDVLIIDIGIPQRNYVDFIKRLMQEYPLPIIATGATGDRVHAAIDAGAADFLLKPDLRLVQSVERYIRKMLLKVKNLSSQGVIKQWDDALEHKDVSYTGRGNIEKIIAIGASVGGTEAIYSILKKLNTDTPGIAIVQHIPPVFSRMFAERLNLETELRVKEAETGDYIEKGNVIIAPGDLHMSVRRVGGRYKVECFKGSKVNGHRPSADILFKSVAKAAGEKAIGIILTGMGNDGARGLFAIRKGGGRTIGQDRGSSIVYGMPKAAFDMGAVEKQAPLEKIPELVCSLLCNGRFTSKAGYK